MLALVCEQVEIAYRAGLERDFVILDDLLTYLMDAQLHLY